MTPTLRRTATQAVTINALLVASMSCNSGDGAEPEPSTAIVSVIAPHGAAPSAPLRIAVVWRFGEGGKQWHTTYDAPLRQEREQQVTLEMPSLLERLELSDKSTVYVRCTPIASVGTQPPKDSESQASTEAQTIAAPVVLPRIVIYEDVDRNSHFNPDLPSTPGFDRLWGISEIARFPVMAFRNLEQTLSSLPLEAAECLRSVTGGTYSEFLQANARAPMESPLSSIRVFVHLSPTDYARVVMNCSLANEEELTTPSEPNAGTPHWWIDAELGSNLCFDKFASCTLGNVATLALPDFTNYSMPGYAQSAECYVFGDLEVLSLTESQVTCEGCRCDWKQHSSRWVIDSVKAPTEWPCGTAVQYCSTPATSLWDNSSPCTLTHTRPE